MTPEQVPDFIRDIVAIGCDPIAVPGVGWVIGDADLPALKCVTVAPGHAPQGPDHRLGAVAMPQAQSDLIASVSGGVLVQMRAAEMDPRWPRHPVLPNRSRRGGSPIRP